ncbi:hypothetical protein GCM10022288_15760 [Gryllotalpicola kribbensis]|uniref:DNA-directed DNA polymerase n=1 Tax=Gryllotalpicola kribbensis TaxID=993084 RepID=A0ABP8ARL0_9MICO
MNTRALGSAELGQFREWLHSASTIGAATSREKLVIADAGAAWSAVSSDRRLIAAVCAAVLDSGRRVWVWDGAQATRVLSDAAALPVDRFRWLEDAQTAFAVCMPGADAPRLPSQLAHQATAIVRLLGELKSADAETRSTIRSSSEVERAFRHVQAAGWRVDEPALLHAREANRDAIERAAREDGINLTSQGSDQQVAAIQAWLGGRGIEIRDRDGNPSLSRDHFARAVVPDSAEGRYYFKRFRDATSRWSEKLSLDQIANNRVDGRVFAKVKVRGAITGRGTITHPNISAISRRNRSMVLSAQPGQVLVSLDLDRVEPSIMAALSGDQVMAEALGSGDLYRETAAAIWGPEAYADDGRRSQAKTAILAQCYGQGLASMAASLSVTQGEARRVREVILTRFTQFAQFSRAAYQAAQRGERQRTSGGRLLAKLAPSEAYKQLNHVVQGSGSDIFYAGIARVARALPSIGLDSSALYLPVHDELILSVPSAKQFEAAALLQSEMATELNGVRIGGAANLLGGNWSKK